MEAEWGSESILVQPQDQLMTTSDLYREYQKSQAEVESRQTAPDPFLEMTGADYSDLVDDVKPPAEKTGRTGIMGDDGSNRRSSPKWWRNWDYDR